MADHPDPERTRAQLPMAEFVSLVALLSALVALAIDAILPALPDIGQTLGVSDPNRTQLVVSVFFVGLSLGQMIAGPLSDAIGRRPVVGIGLVVFALGCLGAILAPSLESLLLARCLQGVGLACPRIASLALVRDLFRGDAMARVLSFVMAVFILVPLVAPALGQLVLQVADWRAIFGLFLLLAAVIGIWFAWRQPETLAPHHRRPLALPRLAAATREVLTCRTTMGYVLTASLISGAFIGYLSSAQQIFQDLYQLGPRFPLAFAALAAAIGIASVVNGRLVRGYGMRKMVRWSLVFSAVLSVGFLALFWRQGGVPPLSAFLLFMFLNLFAVGILFGNLNSLAMEPLGHIAGLGAAVVGSVTTLLSAGLGALVGAAFDGTVLPLTAAFAVGAVASLPVVAWTERLPRP